MTFVKVFFYLKKYWGFFYQKETIFEISWSYVNSQNTVISLKPIRFSDRIKLILYPQVRYSMTQLTLMERLKTF